MRRLLAFVALCLPWPAAAGEPLAEPLPAGLWELAATIKAPFEMRVLEPLDRLLVTSDLVSAVAAMRPDSGMVLWNRKVPVIDRMSGVWALPTAGGGIVLAAGASLHAFRADVGTRLWERDLGCQVGGCQVRVVHASARAGEKEGLLYLTSGGMVQSELARLDPATGAPMWHRVAQVQHPKRVLAAPGVLVAEDSQAPFAVRFFDPADGGALGVWEPKLDGAARPVTELMLLDDGRVVAVDLRPGPTSLAQVTVLTPRGEERTERQVPRPAAVENMAVMASALEEGLAIFTPDTAGGVGYVTTMLLEAPYSARTEQVRSWAEPLSIAGRWAFAPSMRAPGSVWSATGTQRWTREVAGIDASPQRTRTLAAGPRLALVDLGDGRVKVPALATLDAKSGWLHGFGTPELGQGAIDRALLVGDELILTRGKSLFRLVLVPWADAVTKLRATRDGGTDIQPFLTRLARFGAPARALSEALRGGVMPEYQAPPVDGGEAPREGTSRTPVAPPGEVTLTPEDAALLQAFRGSWLDNEVDTLQGMLAAIEQAPERSARRYALLESFATLLLEVVLAPGVMPHGDDAQASLVALARSLEWEAQARRPSRNAAAIYAALMALADESLAGADVLASAQSDAVLAEARLELARRALYLLRKSAGPLRTDTSRQMLASGLRFFKHLEVLVGSERSEVNALLERVANQDASATRALEVALAKVEGPRASKKGAGPALCQLACEATLSVCGEGVSGDVVGCQARCMKSGAVRFSAASRPPLHALDPSSPSGPPWFCH